MEDDYDGAFHLSTRGDWIATWNAVMGILDVAPEHAETNILAGELVLFEHAEIPELANEADLNLRALRYFQQAVITSPAHADAWSGLATCYLYMGRFEESRRSVTQGLRMLNKDIGYMALPVAKQYVGESLYRTGAQAAWLAGNRRAATRLRREGLRRYPESEMVRQALADIDSNLTVDGRRLRNS